MTRRFTAYLILQGITACILAFPSKAQTNADEKYFHTDLNYLDNIYQGSLNPVFLSHNKVRTLTDATFNMNFNRGKYHDADRSTRQNNFDVNISGLQTFNKLDIAGDIRYSNGKEYNRRWNSTLYLTESNPFVIGDSIPSDVTTEQFSMKAGASYRFSDTFTGALILRYKTGNSADQTDPRPDIKAMRFYITPGAEYKINPVYSIGVGAVTGLYRSEISHSNVNTYLNYIYFLMKGTGDYFIRTSNDLASYPREYKGEEYKGFIQFVFTPENGRLSNFLEVSAGINNENSTDGGYAYSFKSGDYNKKEITLYDRISLTGKDIRHNISVNASYSNGNGTWYDQQKKVDTEHGNIVYYEILNKSKIQKSTYLNASAEYRIDFMKENLPGSMIKASAGINTVEIKQYETSEFKQEYDLMTVRLNAGKYFNVSKMRLYTVLGGYYAAKMNDRFASVKSDLTMSYTAPKFEYLSASNAGFEAEISADLPVRFYGYDTWVSLFANAACSFYTDNSTYSSYYKNTSRTVINTGLNIKF